MKSLELAIVPAQQSDRIIIENLIQLYLYDMASQEPFGIEEDGKYDYSLLDEFWEYPYLLRVGGEIAGFALVIEHCPITGRSPCWFMAEFFVLRYHRRKSVGRTAFREIAVRHPGPWHIATLTTNVAAAEFWSKAIPIVANEQFAARHDEMDWVIKPFIVPKEPDFLQSGCRVEGGFGFGGCD
jgi:predicted acetyltransferase